LKVCLAVALGALALPAGAAAPPPYPNNNSAPKVQGSDPRQEGQTLTADPGSWTPAPQSQTTFAYQWMRCSDSGCENISGATKQTYGLAPGEVGRKIKVRVTANCTLPGVCQPMTKDSGTTGTVLPDPHNEAAPEVTGVAAEGQLLSASVGFWRSVAPLSFGYQWIRCDQSGGACVNVDGATGAQYRLVALDVGHTLRAGVTASNNRGRQATVFTRPTDLVQHAAPRAPRRARLLSPFPKIVLAGVLTRSGVAISEFTIRAPRGTLATIRCRGRGCPFRLRRVRLRKARTRVHSLERRLRAGVRIEVSVTKAGFIGKFSRFRVRRGRVPSKKELCLRPGARRPSRCPRGV
jgi:Ig domain of plant-specific actin-binding protein